MKRLPPSVQHMVHNLLQIAASRVLRGLMNDKLLKVS